MSGRSRVRTSPGINSTRRHKQNTYACPRGEDLVFGDSGIQGFGDFEIWIFGYLDIWIFG